MPDDDEQRERRDHRDVAPRRGPSSATAIGNAIAHTRATRPTPCASARATTNHTTASASAISGKSTSSMPAAGGDARPPLNRRVTGNMWPTTAAMPRTKAPRCPSTARPTPAASAPFAKSRPKHERRRPSSPGAGTCSTRRGCPSPRRVTSTPARRATSDGARERAEQVGDGHQEAHGDADVHRSPFNCHQAVGSARRARNMRRCGTVGTRVRRVLTARGACRQRRGAECPPTTTTAPSAVTSSRCTSRSATSR